MAEKKPEVNYQVVQVPTEYGLGIQTPEGEVLTLYQAVALILNKLKLLEKL